VGKTISVSQEFEGADLGDVRLTRRAQKAMTSLAMDPGQSFFSRASDLEGLYLDVGLDL
jgi:hypothetical protein